MRRTTLLAAATILALAVGSLGSVASADAGTTPPVTGSGWTARPETYPGTVTTTDLAIPISDGVVLRGDLQLPADAQGHAIPGR